MPPVNTQFHPAGGPTTTPPPTPPQPVAQTVPAQAMPQALPAHGMPVSQPGSKSYANLAIASLVLGGVSIPASLLGLLTLFIPVLGFVLGLVSVKSNKRGLAISGIVLSVIGAVLSVGLLVRANMNTSSKVDNSSSPGTTSSSGASSGNAVTTDCFTANFPSNYSVTNVASTCRSEVKSADAQQAITILSLQPQAGYTVADFDRENTAAITKELQKEDPGVTITKTTKTTFAGLPAYYAEFKVTGQVGAFYYIYSQNPISIGQYQLFIIEMDSKTNVKVLDSLKSSWKWLQ